MMRISLGYPDEEAEVAILKKHLAATVEAPVKNYLTLEEVMAAQAHVRKIPVAEAVLRYIGRLMTAIRKHEEVELPVSPRGSIALMHAAQAFAFYRGQEWVSIDTIKEIAPEVLAHRVGLRGISLHAGEGARNDWLLSEILQRVDVD